MKQKKIISHITQWLIDYIKGCSPKGFVVGISGGIDSAVTSTLCAKTGAPTLCIEMPIYQKENEIERSTKHIEWLKKQFDNIEEHKLDLSLTFDSFIKNIDENKSLNNALALANTRSRIRMMTLYYFAQINNYLVVGTGNKVEDFGIGFFTKYGDGGVDISPIADLLKTDVYLLAKELNIDKTIINAEPTDGLWDNEKTDEEQIGATYPELEWAMNFHGDKTMISKRQKKVLEIYTNLNKINQHKMHPIPVCQIPNNLK
ncbi:MAG: NAD(+) synthase [Bacteroidota bacterium]|nr:NAD(+) synthase [Bacteroidota bacterium]